jgi:prepilin peptidase CpaA
MVANAIGMVLFPAMMAVAASSDLLTMTISNRISLILLGGFFVLALMTGMSATDTLWHIVAGGTVLIVAFGCFTMGWIGGGDAKLAAATALWFGFDHLLIYLIYASLLGGALTLLLIWFRTLPLPPLLAAQEWVRRLHGKDSGVPYGIALAAAALLVYPDTPWMKAAAM